MAASGRFMRSLSLALLLLVDKVMPVYRYGIEAWAFKLSFALSLQAAQVKTQQPG